MKKIYLLFILCLSFWSWGQISLNGEAIYMLNISGYQGIDPNACGNIFGLRQINVTYDNGSKYSVFNGRIYEQAFNHSIEYTKVKKINNIEFYSINRWKTWIGCEGGPNDDKENIPVSGTCFNYYHPNPLHVTTDVRIVSKAEIKIDFDNTKAYTLGSNSNLKISLPDNLDTSDYNWKYRIGTGQTQSIPAMYNNKAVLDIPADQFVKEEDYGKLITIWVESACQINGTVARSNVFTFTTYLTAPKLINKPTDGNLTCSYSTDGKVLLNFDRLLIPNETIKISIKSLDTGSSFDLPSNILTTSTQVLANNLPAGNYEVVIMGTYNGNNTYTDGEGYSANFIIKKPDPVEFSLVSKTDIYCYGGSDGDIKLNASGGTGSFQYSLDNEQTWISFDNGTETTLKNLVKGNYSIKVRDTNGCYAQENGNTKVLPVILTQPNAPLTLAAPDIKTPTGYGLTNGYIAVDVSGGTPLSSNGDYTYEWRKDSPTGPIVTGTGTVNTPPTSYTLKIDNIGAGKYYLTVTDNNYDAATSNKNTCSIISQEFIVTEPDPLKVDIELVKAISCNIANKFSDSVSFDDNNGNGIPDFAEDGKLKANVTGGVGPYLYKWFKEVNGIYQAVAGETNTNFNNLTEGKYKVEITDANGNATNTEFTLQFPAELKLNLFANTIKCNSQNEGEVSATAIGGTGNYTYQWSTGDNTPKVTGLDAGNYYVVVRDANSCPVDGNIEIVQPSKLDIQEVSVVQPTCSGNANGAIAIKASGGELPYKVEWSNGMTGESISGLVAGSYTVKFTDKNGCFITKTFVLASPNPLVIDLGKDITLCSGDSKTFDAKISDPRATYMWKDQTGATISNTSTVTLTKAGTYTVTITNSNGCSGSDDIGVKTSTDVLQPNFLVATYAFTDRVIEVINTSYEKPEKMEWVIPADAEVVSKTENLLQIKFKTKGSYKVGLFATQGSCEKLIEKEIIVENNDYAVEDPSAKASNIKAFSITPNPNSGQFKILVELNKENSVRVRLMDMQSREVSKPVSAPKAKEFDLPFNYTIPAANYLIILETGNEVLVKKMIVK